MKTPFYTLLLCFLLSPFFTNAQSYRDEEIPKFRHQILLGFPVEIGLSAEIPKTGIHLSYNPTYKLHDFVAVEAQASFTYADFERNSSTFARDGGDSQSLNFLAGGRVYLFGEDRIFRLYGHVLAGVLQYTATEFNVDDEPITDTGISVGFSTGIFAYYDNTWSLGISLETRNFILLRGGYTF